MQYNATGWPIAPERGRYIGFVSVGKPNIDRTVYQRFRVYEDELQYFNSSKTMKLNEYQLNYHKENKQ